MKYKFSLFATVITVLTSCTPVAVKDKLTCEIPAVNTKTSKSENLKVAIYVDGSGSMLGYVNNGKTNYVKALNSIRNVFELIGKLPVEYYRNGNPNQKITGSEYYSYAGTPVFYDGSNAKFKAVSSPIDAAILIPEKNEDKMTVIVTDLEQNSGDVTKLTKKIQDTYFNQSRKDYGVGIWAMKSEFNGTVYAQELNNIRTFTYDSESKTDKFRPFYILFIGPYRDIRYYFDKLKEYDSQQLMVNSNLIIFHPDNIIDNISNIETLPNIASNNIIRPVSLVKNGVSVTKENVPGELLQINKSQEKTLTIDYVVPFYPAPYNLSINTEKKSIDSKVKVESFDQFEKKFQNINNSEINNAIQLQNWQFKDNKLYFSTIIEPNKFPQPGIYKLQFDVFTHKLQAPTWWREWDWQARSNDQDGSKTHNLEEFLIGLKNRTESLVTGNLNNSEENNLLVGRFCYGVQKN